jgi:abhydrolase domain-containing protein 6
VWGDSDRVLDPSGAGVFAAGIRDQETVLMKDMGHSPMIERPDETAAIYLTFLERSIDDETR